MTKSNDKFRANKIFVDRIDPTDLVLKTCYDLEKTKLKQMLVFYGFGGIGKTRLLSELCSKCNKITNLNAFKIGLHTYEYNNIITILLAIRKKLDIDTPVFDYAVVQYYSKCGLPLDNVKEQFKGVKSSLVSGIMKVAEECANIFVPYFSYLQKFMDIVPEIKNIYKHIKNKDDFRKIEEMEVDNLQKYLPEILASYINKTGKTQVIMFDDYESMRNKLDKCAVCDNCDEWIISLFKNVENCLFIFSAREKLNWETKQSISPYLHQYMINKLSDEDSKTFLESVPILDKLLIKNIIKIADGVPLFLDMCVDLYADSVRGGMNSFNLNEVDTSSITDRYLKHFNDNQHNAIKYFVLLDVFDICLARHLLKQLNVGLDEMQLNELLSKCLFEQVDNNTFKLDSSIKSHIGKFKEKQVSKEVAYVLMDYIELSCLENRLLNITKYFLNLLKLIKDLSLKLDNEHRNKLIRCTNLMLDIGYWSDLEEYASHYLLEFENDYYLTLKEYITCQYLKRTGKLTLAKELALSLLQKKEWFGNYKYSVDLLNTQIIHLLGDYDKAIESYKNIIDEMDLFDLNSKDVRTFILTKLKYSDLLFLKGKFKTCLESLKQISLSQNASPDLDVEYRRIKAHIYRFNFDFETASKLYDFALTFSAKDFKSKGALFNNLTESCAFVNPLQAVEYAKQSLDYNNTVNSAIECGKTYTALSIAYVGLGLLDEAKEAIDTATTLFKKTGYKAGSLFAAFAKLYFLKKSNSEMSNLKKILEEIELIYLDIKVYKYLLIYARIFCGIPYDDTEEIEWLDKEKTFKKIKELSE